MSGPVALPVHPVPETVDPPATFRKMDPPDTFYSYAEWKGGTTVTTASVDPAHQPIYSGTVFPVQVQYASVNEPLLQDPIVPPTLVPRVSWRAQTRFFALQEWEGTVLEVREDLFLARLTDLTEATADTEAEFSTEEVSPSDRDLLVPGAIFYWRIGYTDKAGGQRERSSIIRFRRMPRWKEEDLKAAEEEASRLRDLFGRE